MSDGPHKSLQMRRGWKRVAECGDNRAFAPEEVRAALIPALEQDCHAEISPEFLSAIRSKFLDQDGSLFKEHMKPQLEGLRDSAGSGIGRIILDHAVRVVECGGAGVEGLVEATANALTDRAGRGSRQVEEHYRRRAGSSRAQNVRARIEESITGAPISGLARKILALDPRPSARPSAKKTGLDDGVKLR